MDVQEPQGPPQPTHTTSPSSPSSYGAISHHDTTVRDRHNHHRHNHHHHHHTPSSSNDKNNDDEEGDYKTEERQHLQRPRNVCAADDERQYLLHSPQHIPDADRDSLDGGRRRSPFCCGFVCIEIPAFLYFVSINVTNPLTQYYLRDRMYEKLGEPNVTDQCVHGGGGSGSGSGSSLENEIQSRVAAFNIYLSLVSSLPSVIPVLFLGSLSDRFGRKTALYVVIIGTTTKMVVYGLVFHYHWQLEYLFIGCVAEGLTGGFGCYLMASYAIVADVTKEGGKRRGLKIALLEAATMVGSSVGSSTAGYWLQAFGYVVPVLFSVGLQVFLVFFVIVFVPETVASPREATPITCSVWLRSGQVFLRKTRQTNSSRSRRSFLLTCLIAFFLGIFNLIANQVIVILYLLNAPFCWTQVHISLYAGIYMLTSWITVLSFTSCVAHRVADDTLALVGALSGMVGFIFQGLSESDLFIYLGAGCSLLANMAWPMLRTLMSKAVEAEEQGSLFAGIAVTEMLGTTAAGILSPTIYKASLGHVHGLPFLCYAGIDVIMALCLLSLIVRRKMQGNGNENDPTRNQSSEDGGIEYVDKNFY